MVPSWIMWMTNISVLTEDSIARPGSEDGNAKRRPCGQMDGYFLLDPFSVKTSFVPALFSQDVRCDQTRVPTLPEVWL